MKTLWVNMVIEGSLFPHKGIHKYTPTFLGVEAKIKLKNQISKPALDRAGIVVISETVLEQ